MTVSRISADDDILMAYADGELDPLAAKRVERAMAEDPAIAAAVAAHRGLRGQLDAAFAPVLDAPVPDALAALIDSTVVAFAPRPAPAVLPAPRRWLGGLAVAASLVAGVALGTQWPQATGPVSASDGTLVASGELARALDTQLASAEGATRVMASFRERDGGYCRVFAAPALGGIACKDGNRWQLRQTRAASGSKGDQAYRQATSGDTALLAAAQEMMAGEPLDPTAEQRAAAAGWR